MRLIPVIDLLDGVAVHAIAGERARYQPLQSPLCPDPTPAAVARVFRQQLGLSEVYVADLDAIQQGRVQWAQVDSILQEDCRVWLDAGIRNTAAAAEVREELDRRHAGDSRLVVGLETLAQMDELVSIGKAIGLERTIFSLDLKGGRPLGKPPWPDSPLEIASLVVQAGWQHLIVLDLAGVGGGQGPTCLPLCGELRRRFPDLLLTTGGGLRNEEDLRKLEQLGCDAALVATALHRGDIRVPRPDWE